MEKRVHFAPTKTVYSAPQVESSDTSSFASSSPFLSQNGSSSLPPQSMRPTHPHFQSPSPGSSPSSAELATPPPPGFYYGQYGDYGNQGYQGEMPENLHPHWQRDHDLPRRHNYSPSPAHAQPQYLFDQPASTAAYPGTPFYPATELDPYQSAEYAADQYHQPQPHPPSPAFSHSPALSFSSFPSDPYLPISKPVVPRTVHIHYLLAYAPYGDPAFSCDLSRPPPHLDDMYQRFHSGLPYRDGSDRKFDVFFEPATSPPMNSIVITHPSLKFTIDVCAGADTSRVVRPRVLPGHYPRSHYGYSYDDGYGSSSSSDEGDMRPRQEEGFITVADVLVCLYRELRLAIHPVEYAELAPDVAHRVNDAYFSRCASLGGSGSPPAFEGAGEPDGGRHRPDWPTDEDRERERIAEEKKGIRKVDLLMGHTWFIGLSGTLHGPGVWELNVAA